MIINMVGTYQTPGTITPSTDTTLYERSAVLLETPFRINLTFEPWVCYGYTVNGSSGNYMMNGAIKNHAGSAYGSYTGWGANQGTNDLVVNKGNGETEYTFGSNYIQFTPYKVATKGKVFAYVYGKY